ncbi:MAG: hypothetical protein K9L30_02085 [Desulfobacterales bacterium]|nr:hypothetical protein [Desulfobacterales bacterium]
MDKITGVIAKTHFVNTQKKTTAADKFQQTLDKAAARETAGTAANQPVGSLGEIASVMFNQVKTPTENIMNKTINLLNLLDNYSKDMENPENTLKDLEPLIDEINNNALELNLEAGDTLEKDDRLKDIATQTAITASVEYMKFKRGDYV